MNPLQILKSLLFEYKERLEEAENKPSESEIKVSELSIGGKVEMIDADGNLQPAPDGKYTLPSEDKIVVKDGLIESINGEGKEEEKEEEVPVEAEEAPAEEAPAGENPNAEIEALKAEVEAMKADIEAMKAAMGASQEAAEGFKTEITSTVGEFNKTLATIAATPVEFSKTSNNNVVKDSKEEKMNNILSILQNTKKK